MTEQDMYECICSVIEHGSGQEIANFFNELLSKAKGNEEELTFLKKALIRHIRYSMTYEQRDIIKHLIAEVDKELQ